MYSTNSIVSQLTNIARSHNYSHYYYYYYCLYYDLYFIYHYLFIHIYILMIDYYHIHIHIVIVIMYLFIVNFILFYRNFRVYFEVRYLCMNFIMFVYVILLFSIFNALLY